MKYALYIISAILGGILTAGVFPQASLWGLEPDLLLVFAVCCIMISHSPAPVIFTGITAFFIDMFYMGSVGIYTIPYIIVLLAVMWIWQGRAADRLIAPVVTCAVAWIIKDCLSALMVFLAGNTFDFFKLFVTGTLPEAIINCLLTLGFYQLYLLLLGDRFAPAGSDEGPGESIRFKHRQKSALRRNR